MPDMEQQVIDVQGTESALAVKSDTKNDVSSLVKPQDQALLTVIEKLDTLDWKALKPHETAILLMQKVFPVKGGVMTLSFKQALLFAVRCYELGLSPFSTGVWFDPQRGTTNLTLEGKRELARLRGIDMGPPSFEEKEREWSKVARTNETAEAAKKEGFPMDIGVTCKVRIGDPKLQEFSSYTAWLSEWFQPSSPVWKSKPMHMLSIRANEKTITLALGVGASAFPDEREIE
jgi:hypothetical protein